MENSCQSVNYPALIGVNQVGLDEFLPRFCTGVHQVPCEDLRDRENLVRTAPGIPLTPSREARECDTVILAALIIEWCIHLQQPLQTSQLFTQIPEGMKTLYCSQMQSRLNDNAFIYGRKKLE